jgi:hypothetical protein
VSYPSSSPSSVCISSSSVHYMNNGREL